MSSPYASFNTVPDKERGGTYIEFGAFRVKVARAGGKNIKYSTLREALTKPHLRAIQTNTLPKEIQDALNAELAAKALVTAWEIDENFGQVDPISEAALPQKWLAGKMHNPDSAEVIDATVESITKTFVRYNDLYLQIAGHASDIENYLNTDELKESMGN